MTQQARNALVTGASGAIGSAIATALAKGGAAVALHYRSNHAAAKRLADELTGIGARVCLVQGDLATHEGPVALCQAAERELGSIDILVNNAGAWTQESLLLTTLEQWDQLMHTDLRGSFLTIRSLAPSMLARGWGRIVNISSVASDRFIEGEGAYGTAKAGINMLTRAFAVELASHGITVNAIAPALTVGPQTPFPPQPQDHPQCSHVPDRRPGHTREVAALVHYLTSDDAAHVTGQIWAIDGGLSAMSPKAH